MVGELDIDIDLKIQIFLRVDPSDWLLGRARVGGDFEMRPINVPMSAHEDQTLDPLMNRLSTDLLPVCGRLGLLAHHRCSAMGEKEDWKASRGAL